MLKRIFSYLNILIWSFTIISLFTEVIKAEPLENHYIGFQDSSYLFDLDKDNASEFEISNFINVYADYKDFEIDIFLDNEQYFDINDEEQFIENRELNERFGLVGYNWKQEDYDNFDKHNELYCDVLMNQSNKFDRCKDHSSSWESINAWQSNLWDGSSS